ncbi:caspase family protein, partial [Spirulina sp. 06S082]|uniref:caspase family protein n=1 Tax=Spirulina sp. 06S082 TaxID=3110248 RepID=UPI002B1EC954
ALEVAAVLGDRRYCGYPDRQVTVLHDGAATRQRIEAELDQIASTLTEKDTFVLFYSGHGEYGEDGYYLTTCDTRLEGGKVIGGSGVRETTLLEKVKAIAAKRVFLIFNACHAGEISPDSLGGESQSGGRNLPDRTATALLGTGEGRVIITACRESQRSLFLRKDALTFFARSLTEGLRGSGIENRRGYISIFDLYQYVFESVRGEVERKFGMLGWVQEPELTIQKGIGAMAIALHRGKIGEGELGTGDRPPTLGGAVREVDLAESQQVLQQILSGEFTVSGDVNVVKSEVEVKANNIAETILENVRGENIVGKIEGNGIQIGDRTSYTSKST